jgi:phosphate transport system substrate-binding protein
VKKKGTIMKKIIIGLLSVLIALTSIKSAEETKIVIDGSTTVGPIAKAFAEYYMGKHKEVNITISESGSGNGAKSLINAACDIATMSRQMKGSEKESARNAGILPIEHIIAVDGLVIVVHQSNPISDITVEQIKDIYTGKITNWKELGGPDMPIVVISRDTNSGTYETFETLVMKGEKITTKAEYMGSNGAIRQRVLNTPAAIGYVGLAFTEGLKGLKVNGIEPAFENIQSRVYPLSRFLYMYTNGHPREGSHIYNFISLYKTEEGKKIIEDIGFVPVK